MHGFDPFCLGNGRVRFLLIMYAFSLFMEISFFHGLSVGMAISDIGIIFICFLVELRTIICTALMLLRYGSAREPWSSGSSLANVETDVTADSLVAMTVPFI